MKRNRACLQKLRYISVNYYYYYCYYYYYYYHYYYYSFSISGLLTSTRHLMKIALDQELSFVDEGMSRITYSQPTRKFSRNLVSF